MPFHFFFHAAVPDSGSSGVSIRSSVGAQMYLPRGIYSRQMENMTAYRVEQPGQPQPVEIPAARRASPRHILEGIPIASPTISKAPPVTPASSEPSTSAEPRMAIPISDYRELCAHYRP
ncbi:hypothetical protein CK203_093960 [Vitis vinifera]|uniref:Uncharacterized protein n=1 Tax=Vitis vinifera TaxID=29760 RepID=A0A438CKB7_VITVI|nr:hypothetical protein CK203_093960 [Vitis vinifera]